MMGAYSKLSLYPDIKIEAETKRYYPYGKYAAHILGYTGRSSQKENAKDLVAKEVGKIGKTGLEKYYNKVLERLCDLKSHCNQQRSRSFKRSKTKR